MSIRIPILNRSRKFGYIIWKKINDFEVKSHLKDIPEVEVIFEGKNMGKKKVDWKYRRISVGWRTTRPIPNEKTYYNLALSRDRKLSIKCQ